MVKICLTYLFNDQQEPLAQVIVGDRTQPICILGNNTLTVLGRLNKSVPQRTCLVEQVLYHNLNPIIVFNTCLVNPRSKVVPKIVNHSNNYNIWLRKLILAAKLYSVDYHPWDCEALVD